jgi:hypothetical protein
MRDLLLNTASGRFAPSPAVVIFFFWNVSVALLLCRKNLYCKNIYTAKISMQHKIQEEGLSGLPPAFQWW